MRREGNGANRSSTPSHRGPDVVARHIAGMSGPAQHQAAAAAQPTSRTRRIHCFRPWLSSIVAVTVLLQWHSIHAAAQMVAESMAPASPDWSSAHTLLPLLFFLPALPVELAVLVLLYRQRRKYPIAGRGAFFILVCGVNALTGGAINCLLMVAYPRGVPCGIYVLLLWMFLPLVFSMIVRSYLLIFRLEIQSYLSELAWRQEKMARLGERGLIKGTVAKEDGGTIARVAPNSSATDYSAPSDPLAPPTLDPPSIPGHAFITRRYLTEPRWVLTGVGIACATTLLLVVLVSVFDHDVQLNDEWRRARGLPDDGSSSHYDPFLKGPRCFSYSIKSIAFLGLILIGAPLGCWAAWRIRLNSRRMTQRENERAAFDAALREQQQQQQHLLQTEREESGAQMIDSEPDSDRPTADLHAVKELDELSAVRTEATSVALLGLLSTALLTAELSFAYEWINFHLIITYFLVFCIVCVPPLRLSYVIQRRHRQLLLERTRQSSQSGSSGGKDGRLVALVPHHRSLYRLAHVIADPHAYPVLLKFLQKEFSSENALFYIESRRFGSFCRALERTAPGWTSSLDDEDASGSGPSQEPRSSAGNSVLARGDDAPAASPEPTVRSGHMRRVTTGSVHPEPDGACSSVVAIMNSPPLQSVVARADPTSTSDGHERRDTLTSDNLDHNSADARLPSAGRKPALISIRIEQPSGGIGDEEAPAKWPLPGAASPVSGQPAAPSMAVATPAATASTPFHHFRSPTTTLSPPSLRPIASNHVPASRTALASQARPSLPSLRQLHEQACRARQWALQLYADYLQSNAVYQINIDHDLFKMVTTQVKQLHQWQPTPLTAEGEPDFELAVMECAPPAPPPFPLSSLYQQTALSVFHLMETDSFRRFLLTADFRLLLQRADDLEMERVGTQADAAETTHALLQRADQILNSHSRPHTSTIQITSPASSVQLQPAESQAGADPPHLHPSRSQQHAQRTRADLRGSGSIDASATDASGV